MSYMSDSTASSPVNDLKLLDSTPFHWNDDSVGQRAALLYDRRPGIVYRRAHECDKDVCLYVRFVDAPWLTADALCHSRAGSAKTVSERLVWGWHGHLFQLQRVRGADAISNNCRSIARLIRLRVQSYVKELGQGVLRKWDGKRDWREFNKMLTQNETYLALISLTKWRSYNETSSLATSRVY